MKPLGYLLIALGFLGGALLAVQRIDAVAVGPFLALFALGALGVAMVRWATYRAARAEGTVAANLDHVGDGLESVVERIRALDEEKDSIDVYDLRHRIDDGFPELLDRVAQARESVAHRYGLAAYADLMNPFASGERYLNRVWSTSTDGYIDEAHKYLSQAREQFEETVEVFRSLRTSGQARG